MIILPILSTSLINNTFFFFQMVRRSVLFGLGCERFSSSASASIPYSLSEWAKRRRRSYLSMIDDPAVGYAFVAWRHYNAEAV